MLQKILCFLIIVFTGNLLCGEVFLLKEGGKIEGELLNPDEVPRKVYRIKLDGDMVIVLTSKLVERVRKGEREVLLEYNTFAPFEEDTIDNHLRIASWCSDNFLPDLARKHRLRILDHNPDHKEARQNLGHIRADDGTWITRQEKFAQSGLIKTKGNRYRTQQQIEVEQILENRRKAGVLWDKRIGQLRAALPGDKARAELLAINDPAAIRALSEHLSAEPNEDSRIVLVKTLANIRTHASLNAIARWAISPKEGVREVRTVCFEELIEHPEALPGITGYYLALLNPANDNRMINAAGFALGQLNAKTAIPYLIDALETVHERQVILQGPAPTFGADGNAVMGGGQKKITQRNLMQNREVLGALIRLTGVNFQYDKNRWKAWLIDSRKTAHFNARRD